MGLSEAAMRQEWAEQETRSVVLRSFLRSLSRVLFMVPRRRKGRWPWSRMSTHRALVGFMDYVVAGQVIELGAAGTLKLGYLKSCLSIRPGTS